MACAASITALRLAPQTLLIVIAPTVFGRPARRAHCRAMFCPNPAETTLPISTSSIAARSGKAARSLAARIATAPSSAGGDRTQVPSQLSCRRARSAEDCGGIDDRAPVISVGSARVWRAPWSQARAVRALCREPCFGGHVRMPRAAPSRCRDGLEAGEILRRIDRMPTWRKRLVRQLRRNRVNRSRDRPAGAAQWL